MVAERRIRHFLCFYAFCIRKLAATCDCQRFSIIREIPCWKKVSFFPVRVFLGRAEVPGPWSSSDCQTTQSALVHACVLSLLCFLFFFIGGHEGQYFPLPPRASIYLVAPLGLWLPDPNANPSPIL